MKWKIKYFYIKAVGIRCKLTFRNVTDTIITQTISVPRVDVVDWFPWLRIIGWKKLSNSQLWVLRMMLGRMSRKARPVVREKSGEDAPLWRIFDPDFKGKVEAMEAELPQGKGNLGALGDPDATGVPKKHVEKGVRIRNPKKKHEPAFVPPFVPQVASISRTCLRRYTDYVVVSDTHEGLGVPGGTTGGSSTGSKSAGEKKRKVDAAGTGERKRPKLRTTWTAAISQPKPAARSSPPRDAAADSGANKKFRRSPSIKVVTPPATHAEDTRKKTTGHTIFDTVDSSDKLIEPRDLDVPGGGGGGAEVP
ncbi:hypothetical protein Hanom_Chr13g01189931 [Helianthus anomalus]